MYISKGQYYFLKVISVIGNNLWSFLCFVMVIGLFMDMARGDFSVFQTDIPSIICAFGTIWGAHLVLRFFLEKIKVYNGIFANDADGILQTKVVARALGLEESKVVFEIKLLCKLKLLKNCMLQTDGSKTVIILSGKQGAGLDYKEQLQVVVCPHCGGENHIRAGFVQSCRFCSGKLDEGGIENVSK